MGCDTPLGFVCEVEFSDDQLRVGLQCTKCCQEQYMHHQCYSQWQNSIFCVFQSISNLPLNESSPPLLKQHLLNLSTIGNVGLEAVCRLCICSKCCEGLLLTFSQQEPLGLEESARTMFPSSPALHSPSTVMQCLQVLLSQSSNLWPSDLHRPISGKCGSRAPAVFPASNPPHSNLQRRQRTLSGSGGNVVLARFHDDPTAGEHPVLQRKCPTSTSSGKRRSRPRSFTSFQPAAHSGQSDLATVVVEPTNQSIPRGNIFKRRGSYMALLDAVPREKGNAYFICMEEDGCNGNDELKAVLLTKLTGYRATHIRCMVCRDRLDIYDHFPLVDGALFLSPIQHDVECAFALHMPHHQHQQQQQQASVSTGLAASAQQIYGSSGSWLHKTPFINSNSIAAGSVDSSVPGFSTRFLHAICLCCMHAEKGITCKFCGQPWSGWSLLVGGLYHFDVFASQPCCDRRSVCKRCGLSEGVVPALDSPIDLSHHEANLCSVTKKELSFSGFSEPIVCKLCHTVDYHLVKVFADCFHVNVSSLGRKKEVNLVVDETSESRFFSSSTAGPAPINNGDTPAQQSGVCLDSESGTAGSMCISVN